MQTTPVRAGDSDVLSEEHAFDFPQTINYVPQHRHYRHRHIATTAVSHNINHPLFRQLFMYRVQGDSASEKNNSRGTFYRRIDSEDTLIVRRKSGR